MKKMKLCMMSLMMGEMRPEEIAACAARCGMTGIDWITLHRSTAEELKKLSDDAGLHVAAHTPLDPAFVQGKSDGLDEFRHSLENACILGADNIVVPPFQLVGQKSMREARKRWIGFYEKALPLAEDAGVNLCMESTGFLKSPVVSGAELQEVIAAVPRIRIAFDNGNTATADDMTAAFELVKEHVVHFHLKDWKIFDAFQPGSDLKRTGKYYRDCVIGEGDLDLPPFLKNHVLPVYDGFFNLEASDPSGRRSPKEVMRDVCAYLKALSLV